MPNPHPFASLKIFDDKRKYRTRGLIMSKMLEVPDHLVPALERMLATSLKKRNDYSRVGPWQNFKDTSAFFRLKAWQSAIFNCVQKLCRVQSLSDGREVMNEPLEDTLLDFANYALFAYAMFLEELAPEAAQPVVRLVDDPEPYEPPKPFIGTNMRSCCDTDVLAEHRPECRHYSR